MLKFSKLDQWRYNPANGDVEAKFLTVDGRQYEASFTREMVPELLVRMHQMLSATADEFPRGLKELAEAYIPISVSVIHLPNGVPALEIVTQTEMRVPIPLLGNASEQIRSALADAHLALTAQQDQAKH